MRFRSGTGDAGASPARRQGRSPSAALFAVRALDTMPRPDPRCLPQGDQARTHPKARRRTAALASLNDFELTILKAGAGRGVHQTSRLTGADPTFTADSTPTAGMIVLSLFELVGPDASVAWMAVVLGGSYANSARPSAGPGYWRGHRPLDISHTRHRQRPAHAAAPTITRSTLGPLPTMPYGGPSVPCANGAHILIVDLILERTFIVFMDSAGTRPRRSGTWPSPDASRQLRPASRFRTRGTSHGRRTSSPGRSRPPA
jgi:hypothetical protein